MSRVAAPKTAEHLRLAESEARRADWKRWGPYVSERAWGTVREDYSASGDAWNYFPHDHARSRAYRWNEDGLAGFCNRFQNVCLALAFWNERDPILKERLFGLSGPEGNHGEDVKEYYYYLDGTPTHSYMKMLYKYPQVEFPYGRLVEENGRRSRSDPEYELFDAIGEDFRAGRYFDIFIEYAKATQEDVLCRITAVNRGPEAAPLHVLPHLWYRNTWSWGYHPRKYGIRAVDDTTVHAEHRHFGDRWWSIEPGPGGPALLFTENETNYERLFGAPNLSPYVKDAFHETIIHGRADRVNPERRGSKTAAHYHATVAPGGSWTVRVRFSDVRHRDPFHEFDAIFANRIAEANQFHAKLEGTELGEDERRVQRQAIAGLLWSKQCYHYSVELWLKGDPAGPPPPPHRAGGRNANWSHLYAIDVLTMPDKWEYPWFAAWDTAFQAIPLAIVDPEWAKRQIVLLLREWYMHPNGQIPAYEWNFSDVNPPVHAWAARRVFEITRDATGYADLDFLEEVFHKLLLNFTWWVNRKDAEGRNAFQGGFLGLDNIGVFDRSDPVLSDGQQLEQADGTAWMGRFCLDMLAIAIELSRTRPAYEAMATKFFEHFIAIGQAINGIGGEVGMWDECDGFYYDVIRSREGGAPHPLRIRSFVGLIPLFATLALDPDTPERLPRFWRRVEWFLKFRPMLASHSCLLTQPGPGGHRLLALVDRARLERILSRMLDPAEFLSNFGLRSLSKRHATEPSFSFGHSVTYEPAESTSPMYGGNSNWRGPVWFPVNAMMISALRMAYRYYGDSVRVPFPTGLDGQANLDDIATELSRRLIRLFLRDEAADGWRPFFGDNVTFQTDPHWRDYLQFHEYFHGDNGAGLGASHQTGWTALVALLIRQCTGEPTQAATSDLGILQSDDSAVAVAATPATRE
jgi:hypothetical protein